MNKVLIIGAGAIGRGYVPWLFSDNTEIDFADNNNNLILEMKNQGFYMSYMTKRNGYKEKKISVKNIININNISAEDLNKYDYIITAVGPRNFLALTDIFASSKTNIICFENDRSLVFTMRLATGRDNIYFGIPDVISSNASNPNKKEWPPLSLITENGETFVESEASSLGGNIKYVDENEIRKQWAAKLYIHNTPHCIAAYLGSLCRKTYLHESMEVQDIRNIVIGATNEMKSMVNKEFDIDQDFLDYYAEKEIKRFSNKLLFDPVSRVAREPFRKLGLNDRLIGAARKSYAHHIKSSSLIIGIMSAFLFEVNTDQDAMISPLFNYLSCEDFLSVIIRLSPSDVVYDGIKRNWDYNKNLLMKIKNDTLKS